jgi:hypothetical protein
MGSIQRNKWVRFNATNGPDSMQKNCPDALICNFFSCDDKEECSLRAEDLDLGPDPCPDTERYLEAHFTCIQTALAKPPGNFNSASLTLCYMVMHSLGYLLHRLVLSSIFCCKVLSVRLKTESCLSQEKQRQEKI